MFQSDERLFIVFQVQVYERNYQPVDDVMVCD